MLASAIGDPGWLVQIALFLWAGAALLKFGEWLVTTVQWLRRRREKTRDV